MTLNELIRDARPERFLPIDECLDGPGKLTVTHRTFHFTVST